MPKPQLPITGDPDADGLLVRDPLALLIGMLLDQQVPMEWAFKGPSTLRTRLGHLDPEKIATMAPDAFLAVCADKPAVHRFPKAMAGRIQELCQVIVDEYGGDASRIWKRRKDPADVLARIQALPGYGPEKSKIFLAILGKRFGAAPAGWEACATPFGDAQPRSVADVGSRDALLAVRAWKKAMKEAGKAKTD
jgi:uncharacterized HhH-GPD family protein